MSNKTTMDTWGSRVTINRFNNFDLRVFRDIQERVGIKTLNRQVGNIIADLRKAGENDWETEIKVSIERYNEAVEGESARKWDKWGEIDPLTGRHLDPSDYAVSQRGY